MKKKKKGYFEASEDDALNTENLFAIQGGEDEDLDEDCYFLQCVVSASYCISPKTDCYFAK